MTQAEVFAELFHRNGTVFETDAGITMDQMFESSGVNPEYSRRVYDRDDHEGGYRLQSGYACTHISGDPIRYEFSDGSCIVVAGEAWDFEGKYPFSWAG